MYVTKLFLIIYLID